MTYCGQIGHIVDELGEFERIGLTVDESGGCGRTGLILQEVSGFSTDLLEVHVVQVVLHVLYTGVVISRVKLIRDVHPRGPNLRLSCNNTTTT